ncbi:MAG TPA: 1,4-dihydroxy-2-naphthoate polyprenyltransferase [Acidimicrobiia bacterium]|nr:1,4-dihydroxy-2-naphthoate polyprenyltransferase [Acidimicrobiia bacterium]
MTTAAEWVQGARPRTLGAAIVPVVVATALASTDAPTIWWRAFAALVVALALQIGVNYANDYSDGVRGTDVARRGPLRLTATGTATPQAVRTAALLAFAVAAVAGLALAIAVDLRLLIVGGASIAAAVLYTGGPRPYGYSGFGEVAVLAFFGVVATVGTVFVQLDRIPGASWPAALAVGLPAVAILVVNNLRDIDTDRVANKHTLAVRIGAARTRALFLGALAGALVATALLAIAHPWALLGLAAAPFALVPIRIVRTRADAPSLVRALVTTARFQLVLGALLVIGLEVAR